MNPDLQTQAKFPAFSDAAIFLKKPAGQKDLDRHRPADFKNSKWRTQNNCRWTAEAEQEALIGEVSPVFDNFERGLEASRVSNSLYERVSLPLNRRLLQNKIEAPVTPHRLETACIRQNPCQPDLIVIKVTQRGHCCGEQVVRPARFAVYSSRGDSHVE